MTDEKFTKIAVDEELTKLAAADVKTSIKLAKGLIERGLIDKIQMREVFADPKERAQVTHKLKVKGLSNRAIAAVVGVSHTTVANDLAGNNLPENGNNLPHAIEVSQKDILEAAKEIRGEQQSKKREKRDERESVLAEKQTALPNKKYGVIVADPEWRFEPYSRETGMDRSADNHYPTSPTDEIAARGTVSLGLKAISIAAKDCVLFLWATAPMIEAALEVMEAWGFDYKSQFVWIKDKIGTGYWSRNKHEILLVGTRGDIPAPAMGTQWPSAIEAPVGKHSVKPEKFLEMIESYFPSLPKIELNRRGPARLGWDAWGNEIERAAVAADEADCPVEYREIGAKHYGA